ncbi:phosphonate metabolism protein/1,5-bisphosphokinase (PRPP-forming) PhnN [Acidocella sp.]|jgi:ribose 1,5-bisphosphokinase|uniref:phosphonate metabolism protein/1,5-bisphosphokinase (PRPP-forming) PhnN n=1 Tax=Acidocella sp. TaxID=50710 RepID=UPI002F414346
MTPGHLVLIVGPSGAGKDTLLNLARTHFAACEDVVFQRRVITRPADTTEDHEPITEAEFEGRDFALSWRAHGLCYGIPLDLETKLEAGKTVITNVSRTIVGGARLRFRTFLIEITASPHVLAERLAGRGRETAADIAARIKRSVATVRPDSVIVNDSTPAEAAAQLISVLEALRQRKEAAF